MASQQQDRSHEKSWWFSAIHWNNWNNWNNWINKINWNNFIWADLRIISGPGFCSENLAQLKKELSYQRRNEHFFFGINCRKCTCYDVWSSDPSILRHSGISDEAMLNIVHEKKSPIKMKFGSESGQHRKFRIHKYGLFAAFFKPVLRIPGSASGSFYNQSKIVKKPYFLLLYDFFMTFYLWKMIWM